jgi:hypothetical protein
MPTTRTHTDQPGTRAPGTRQPGDDPGRTRPRQSRHVALIDQMAAEWHSTGRAPSSVRALRAVAARDAELGRLVIGSAAEPPPCPTPFDVVAHMRRAKGRSEREAAAHLVRVLLREADADPLVCRMLVQALVPGLVGVAAALRWGRGGEWQDRGEFFAELVSTTWVVLSEWSGQDRPYAVLDLLSAIRCRLRRQLFRAKDHQARSAGAPALALDEQPAPPESDLDRVTALLLELQREGMRTEDVQVLYAQHVLGYSIAELSAMTGRDRRSLYARRDRGRERLSA